MRTETMLHYVAETPAVLRAQAAGRFEEPLVDAFVAGPRRVVRVVASGSSRNAALCARPYLRRALGVEVLVTDPWTFVHHEYEVPADEFVVCVSQSGFSSAAIDALDRLRHLGRPAIGITGDVASDFRAHCDVLVDYGVGTETVGYVTKGVSALHAFLCLFADAAADRLGRDRGDRPSFRGSLDQYLAGYEAVRSQTRDVLRAREKELTSMGPVFVLGSGPDLGVASEGALKLAETLQVPAVAVDLEEFLHGPHLQLTPLHTVVVVATGSHSWARSRQIHAAARVVTDRVLLLTDDPGADDADVRIDTLVDPLAGAPSLLPFFQTVSYEITERKHLWRKHPLLARFEAMVSGKSENYVDREVV
ncbi:SIS domain-containing protein [Kineococcus sp. SYSU DK001]|uniref:SIS domain-containing protein n=1 Tax=Kineococcus sp. SYSU DK001 TaxID=3383122 RepID=UPI003D7C823A